MDDWKAWLKEIIKPLLSMLVERGFDRLEERAKRFERLFIRTLTGGLLVLFGLFFLTLGSVLLLTRLGVALDVSLLAFAIAYLLAGGFLLTRREK